MIKDLAKGLIAFVLCVGIVSSQNIINPFRFDTGAPPAACDRAVDHYYRTAGGDFHMAQFSSQAYWATKFYAHSGYDVCAASAWMTPVGTIPAGTELVASIYTHDGVGDEPDTQLGTSSDALDATTLSGTDVESKFTNISATLTEGNYYWLVIEANQFDGSNYVEWEYSTYYGGLDRNFYSSDGLTWTHETTPRQPSFALYQTGDDILETIFHASNVGDGGVDLGRTTSTAYAATRFIAESNHDIVSYSVILDAVGSPATRNIYASIYNDDSGARGPRDMISPTESAAISTDDITATEQRFEIALTAPDLIENNAYWLVLRIDGTADASNHVHWQQMATSSTTEDQTRSSANGTTWSAGSEYRTAQFQTYTDGTTNTYSEVVNTDLVAWYDFNTTGTTADLDNKQGTADRDLTELNNPTYQDGYGTAINSGNHAWTLDGTAINDHWGNTASDSYSLVCRFRVDHDGPVIFKGRNGQVLVKKGSVDFRFDIAGNKTDSHDFADNRWMTVVSTYTSLNATNGDSRGYVNGELVVENLNHTWSGGFQTATIEVVEDGGSGVSVNTDVDFLGLYNRALTLEEIRWFGNRSLVYADINNSP